MSYRSKKKTIEEISKEWDCIGEKRIKEIQNGHDFSFTGVNAPCILNYLKDCERERVLDVGCGSGYLTHMISQISGYTVGIDASQESISAAKKSCAAANLDFFVTPIARFHTNQLFDTCVANMVLMTDPDMNESVQNICRLLKRGGHFLITITHPCFWPRYWQYDQEPWFDYNKEIFIENTFHTSLSQPLGITTHIHRPLHMYMRCLLQNGFTVAAIDEPYPVQSPPEGYFYAYPRFLFIMAKKI